ncbi:hypothetical protein [Streptomyces sp. NPDC048191]|uniref:RICIN domain-containing protein n=1 Tax=Streptomyces sp. NPDC048191 TaxID=3155484 RepID=UPI0033E22B4E
MSNQANAPGSKSGHLPAKVMLIHMITNNYLIPDSGNDSVEGDAIQLYYPDPIDGTYAPKWHLERDTSTGAYYIKTQNSGRYLNAETVAPWTHPRLRSTGLTSSMLWDFVSVPGVPDTVGEPPVRAIVSRGNSYALAPHQHVLPANDTYVTHSRMWGDTPSFMHAFKVVPTA